MTSQLDIFYNTTKETGEKLKANKAKASTQNEKILGYFVAQKGREFTPAEIYIAFGQQWPITSVRRSITTLTNLGYLEKTETKRKGIFGESNCCWRLDEGK